MYKIVGVDGQHYGPVSLEQIKQWLVENRVNGQTLAITDGATDWKPLSSFPEFAAEFRVPPPLLGQPPPLRNPGQCASDRASNKVAAGVCGILLGALGIHKFILGYTGAGLIMLLVTVLSCGCLAPITYVIGLIEGIVYLTKSDEEFVRTYVDGRKEWF